MIPMRSVNGEASIDSAAIDASRAAILWFGLAASCQKAAFLLVSYMPLARAKIDSFGKQGKATGFCGRLRFIN